MNLIETDRLTRRFWRTEAVSDLTFSVPAGSVTALLGPNGAGKTTTLKVLLNLLRPTGGVARVLGVPSTRLGCGELRRIGYVSENQVGYEWMTVRQLLDFCRSLYPSWDRALEQRLLREFDLPGDRRIAQLSRGMKMKAMLLSSLAYRPDLVVLDEPFGGLDPLARKELIAGLIEAASLGEWSMLVSSHDVDDVERLVDRVVLLDHGGLVLQDSTDALAARFRRVEVEFSGLMPVGLDSPGNWRHFELSGGLARFVDRAFAEDTLAAACDARFPGARVIVHPMTLREIYLAVVGERRRHVQPEAMR